MGRLDIKENSTDHLLWVPLPLGYPKGLTEKLHKYADIV